MTEKIEDDHSKRSAVLPLAWGWAWKFVYYIYVCIRTSSFPSFNNLHPRCKEVPAYHTSRQSALRLVFSQSYHSPLFSYHSVRAYSGIL